MTGNRRRRPAAALLVAGWVLAPALTGCGVLVSNPAVLGRAHEPMRPLTPEQSRAQVVDVATEIVTELDISVTEAVVWRTNCSGTRPTPLRGQVRIGYPAPSNWHAARSETEAMIRRLADTGWHRTQSHSPAVTRDGVVVLFRNLTGGPATRSILVFGECRDVVPKAPGGERPEPVTLR